MADDSRGAHCTRRQALAVLGTAALAGCSTTIGGPSGSTTIAALDQRYDVSVSHDTAGLDSDWEAPTTAPPVGSLETETLVENLEVPWDLSFGPDGTLFISERVGRVLSFDGGETSVVTELDDVIDAGSVTPGGDNEGWWVDGGEGGTLGVAAHPTYPEPPLVYVYYTTKTDEGKRNRVVAFDPTAEDPESTAGVLVDGIPADQIHNGGRLTFGPENYLWVTCGDAGEAEKARDTSTFNGKILRMTPTGDPAPGNPDLGSGADPRIFTYGHRNPQGVVWLPDGTPVVSEHGDGGQDELNRLVAGHDYGWPDVRFLKDYSTEGVHGPLASSGKATWAPTGSLFYTGDAVPSLTNRMLVGGLFSQQLLIATLTPPDGTLPPVGGGTRHDGAWSDDAYTVTTQTALKDELGRIRHVEQGPDGGIYLVTSNRDGRAKDPYPTERDDRLVRLTTA